ncbi:hypothetical protein [Actinoallomurus iriomotensis]|uniref:hypothetical protein n=1 Tax=Actinoallomurus iriomotensis TaxID=478107 RepID=UPI0025525D40|nr:hypothetical protein [Actinoallomurus iriomotensis]
MVGGVALGADLTRKPTANEIEAAGRKEMASRWRALKAGEIFPARVNVKDAGDALREFTMASALRVGIAPGVSCSEGFDRPLADVLVHHGCQTVLRATYVDSSGTLLTTLGVAVMPDGGRASDAETDFTPSLGAHGVKERYGVRAVSFPGTVAEGFRDSLRQDFSYEANGTPYLFFRSSGWMTDRAAPVEPVVTDTFAFAESALDEVELKFAEKTAPCERRGVRC